MSLPHGGGSASKCKEIAKSKNRGLTKGWFPKGWVWRMFPRNENRNEGTFGRSPERKSERGYVRMFPRNENRNEGTFANTTLYETALLSSSEKSKEHHAKQSKVSSEVSKRGWRTEGGRCESLVRKPHSPFLTKGAEVLETAMGSMFCPDQVLLSQNGGVKI